MLFENTTLINFLIYKEHFKKKMAEYPDTLLMFLAFFVKKLCKLFHMLM